MASGNSVQSSQYELTIEAKERKLSRKRSVGMVVGGATIASIAVSQAVPLGANAQAVNQVSSSPSTLTQDQAVAAGQLTMSVVRNSDGSTTSKYVFPSGLVAVSSSPPRGFSPLTASTSDLVKFGFPPRPSSPSGLQQWTTLMSAWKSTPAPKLTFTTENMSAPGAVSSASGGTGSPYGGRNGCSTYVNNAWNCNWAGWGDYASSQAYFGAESDFIAPNLGARCPADQGGPFMAIWTGLGGFNSDSNGTQRLIQSGIYANGLGGPTVWAPFWEVINTQNYHLPPQLMKAANSAVAINPGDSVFSKTVYVPGSKEDAFFYLEDITTGQTASMTLYDNPYSGAVSNFFDGSTAEFVSEFPGNEVGNSPVETALPFQQFAMVNNQYYNGSTWNPLGAATHEQFTSTPWLTSGPIGTDNMQFAEGFLGC